MKKIIPLSIVGLSSLAILAIPSALVNIETIKLNNNNDIQNNFKEQESIKNIPTTTSKILTQEIVQSLGWHEKQYITLSDWKAQAPNVEEISWGFAFANSILVSIEIPASIKIIGQSSFQQNLHLTSITFEPGSLLKSIETIAFLNTGIIENFIIPKQLENIGDMAFAHSNLKRFTFEPDSTLKSIGDNVFDNSQIESVKIPKSVMHIGKEAFKNTAKLVDISMPVHFKDKGMQYFGFTQTQWNSIEWIYTPFLGTELDTVEILNLDWDKKSVITLSDWETFAPNVTVISGAFLNNQILTSIEIPGLLKTIGDNSFDGATNLKTIIFEPNSKLSTIGFNAFKGNAISSIVLPSTVSVISTGAFSESQIESIKIPESVGFIGENAFKNARKLVNISIPVDFRDKGMEYLGFTQPQWDAIVWTYAFTPFLGTELDKVAAASINWHESTTITLADWATYAPNVTIISGAFQNQKKLSFIEIPSQIKSIGNSSFFEASNLKKAVFATNSNLTSIGFNAFRKTAISSIIIPPGVSVINGGAFAENSLLTSVALPEQLQVIEDSLFRNSGLEEVNIPNNVVEIQALAFGDTIIKKINISNNMEKIASNAFSNTRKLMDITLPFRFKRELINFGFTQFQWDKINWVHPPTTDVTLLTPDIFKQIGWANKEVITLDDWAAKAPNVVEIEPGIWQNNKSIKTIYIPDNIRILSDDLFENSTLQSIYFAKDSQLHTISTRAFQGTNIKKIEIPESVEVIQHNAFASTVLLNEIYMYDKFDTPNYELYGFSSDQYENIQWIYEKTESTLSLTLIIVSSVLFVLIIPPSIFLLVYTVKKIRNKDDEDTTTQNIYPV